MQGREIIAEAGKKAREFKVGHVVRWTGEFLRSTGQQVGAPINGEVKEMRPGLGSGPEKWPMVMWSDAREAKLVNPANIELDPRAKAVNDKVESVDEAKGSSRVLAKTLPPLKAQKAEGRERTRIDDAFIEFGREWEDVEGVPAEAKEEIEELVKQAVRDSNDGLWAPCLIGIYKAIYLETVHVRGGKRPVAALLDGVLDGLAMVARRLARDWGREGAVADAAAALEKLRMGQSGTHGVDGFSVEYPWMETPNPEDRAGLEGVVGDEVRRGWQEEADRIRKQFYRG